MLDPEQEFFLVVISSTLKSLNSLGPDLGQSGTSLDFRRALEIVARTLTELATMDEIREFEGHIDAIRQTLRREQDAARQTLARPAG